MSKNKDPDTPYKSSPFYIRQKLEIGTLADDFLAPWLKYTLYVVLVIYMYGAMCLKYVAGAESFVEGLSFSIWGDSEQMNHELGGFDPYYLGLIVFGTLSLSFCFGNIENSKYLQIVATSLRFLAVILMTGGSVYSIAHYGVTPKSEMTWFNFGELDIAIGNIIFIFICHHSISGIVYPVRPQKHVPIMFKYSFLIGAIFLLAEALLAAIAFTYVPGGNTDRNHFPVNI